MKKVILWLLFLITAAYAWEDNEDEYYNNHEHCGEHGELVDTQYDVNHCGQCNTICLPNEACVGGACKCLNNNKGCGPTCLACLPNQDCVGGVCIGCPTGTICFDDLNGNGMAVPNGYANLNWTNLYVIDGKRAGEPYSKAVISSPNVIFTPFYDYYYTEAVISSNTPFTAVSVYITLGTTSLATGTITTDTGYTMAVPLNGEPFFITFPAEFSNIKSMAFNIYPVVQSYYNQAPFALDNLVVNF
jgi:hypothetical protein